MYNAQTMSDHDRVRSACPLCGAMLETELVERERALLMKRVCPEHGEQLAPFRADAAIHRRSVADSCDERLPAGDLRPFWNRARRFVTTLALDVTNRCNLKCPVCFADANAAVLEPSLDELERIIPDAPARGFRPNLALVGGESTLRPDLPEIVRLVRRKGYEPRLNSNGLALVDPALLERLREAGLRWVILQMDGLDPQISLAFRGRDLTEHKRTVLELLGERGFLVHFAVMVVKGVNDSQLGALLSLAMRTRHVLRVSFYPQSAVGRLPAAAARTDAADVLEAIERTTDGQVTVADVLEFRRLSKLAFKLTKHPLLRTRPCIFPFVLMQKRGRLVPITRLVGLRGALREPMAALRLLAGLPGLAGFDRGNYSSDFLICNVEKFYDTDAFDLDAALNCHHVVLEGRGAFPFCYYNSFVRSGGPWPKGM